MARDGRIVDLARNEVSVLYRRPGSRLGVAFLAGAIGGAGIGWWAGGALCDGSQGCEPSYWRSTARRNTAKTAGAVAGAIVLSGLAHNLDQGARGMDPSDWTQIEWPTRPTIAGKPVQCW